MSIMEELAERQSKYEYAKFLVDSGKVSGNDERLCNKIVNSKGSCVLSSAEKILFEKLLDTLRCEYCGEVIQSDELDPKEELVCSRCRHRLAKIDLE